MHGFRQLPTVDYDKTFAAVPKATTFRLFFILTVQHVRTAFLYGIIDRESRNLSRILYDLLSEVLTGAGLTRSFVDNCLFFKLDITGQMTLLVLVHVADLMTACASAIEIQSLKNLCSH